jgi:hypothetical protein
MRRTLYASHRSNESGAPLRGVQADTWAHLRCQVDDCWLVVDHERQLRAVKPDVRF